MEKTREKEDEEEDLKKKKEEKKGISIEMWKYLKKIYSIQNQQDILQ